MNSVIKKIKQAKGELIMFSIANIILGIFLIVKPESAMDLVCRIIGIVLTIWGIVRMVNYFRVEATEAFGSFGLVQGVALIAFGVYIIVEPHIMAEIFTVLVAILIIIGGVFKIQYAVDLKRMQSTYWWLELVVAITLLILGATALFNPFYTTATLMIFVGCSLMVNGILDIISITRISVVAKKVGKEIQDAVKNI